MPRKGERLIFPTGLRFPVDGEFPAGYESDRDKIAAADITVGFVQMDAEDKPFKHCFEANVHGTDVWRVFEALSQVMFGEVAAPILCVKEDEPVLGPYTKRVAAVKVFEEHQFLLANDGMLEFGLTFQHQDEFEEVYVAAEKYFKIWTNKAEAVIRTFEGFGVPQEESLEFIDQYPHMHVALYNDEGEPTWDVVSRDIVNAFRELPLMFPPE